MTVFHVIKGNRQVRAKTKARVPALGMLVERMQGFTGPGGSITGTCSVIERESTG